MGPQPSTLHFQVENELKELPGTSPKTTGHVHFCVPLELRIAGAYLECECMCVCVHKTFLQPNEFGRNGRFPSTKTSESKLKAQLFQQN